MPVRHHRDQARRPAGVAPYHASDVGEISGFEVPIAERRLFVGEGDAVPHEAPDGPFGLDGGIDQPDLVGRVVSSPQRLPGLTPAALRTMTWFESDRSRFSNTSTERASMSFQLSSFGSFFANAARIRSIRGA